MPTEVFTPRDYQSDAVGALKKHFKRSKKGVLVLPTGGGKTFTAWNFLKEEIAKDKKILWVVHRDYLIPQCVEGMEQNGITTTISYWTADQKDDSGQVVVAMILSTSALEGTYDWVIFDECHRSAALSYKNLEERLTIGKKLGLSATPERLDKKDLDLGQIVYQISFGELVDRGWLAKPDVHVIKTGQTFQFTVSGGDISRQSLKKINNPARNEAIIKHVLAEGIDKRKILIFGVDLDHVSELQKLVAEAHPGISVVVHSQQTKLERSASLKHFAQAAPRVLCNCEVFTEGFDQKDITDVVMARPTVSRSLWVQMVGRGARIIQGVKDSFRLWVPIDDLNKYAWLARDWCLSEASTDIEGRVQDPSGFIGRVDEALEELDCPIPDISSAEKLTVTGFVVTKSSFDQEEITHVITDDRYKCLLMLQHYFSQGNVRRLDLKDWIELSYAYCVTGGEFTINEWKNLGWAFYLAKVVKSHPDRWRAKWVEKPKLCPEEMMRSYSENINLCNQLLERFSALNSKFGNIWSTILRRALKNMPKSSKWIAKTVTGVMYSDRALSIQTNIPSFKPSTGAFIRHIYAVAAEMLEDDGLVIHLRLNRT